MMVFFRHTDTVSVNLIEHRVVLIWKPLSCAIYMFDILLWIFYKASFV